jgi:hypothetical protein
MDVDGEIKAGQIQDDLAPSVGSTCREKLGGLDGFSSLRMGFGSPDLTKRQAGLYNLYHIMRGWRAPYGAIPSDVESAVERLAPSQTPSVGEVDRAEYLVGRHYIRVFADFFRRPPTIPSTNV